MVQFKPLRIAGFQDEVDAAFILHLWEVSSISWIRVWVEIRFLFLILLLSPFSCYTTKLLQFCPRFGHVWGHKKKGEIGLLREFHGTAGYYVTKSKQWCCNFCIFMTKFHSQLNYLCQFINVKVIFHTYFSIIQSSLTEIWKKCVLFIYSTMLLCQT